MDIRTRKQGEQIILATVYEHGAAHAAGLSAMDAFVAIDGIKVDANVNTLDTVLERYMPGTSVTVHVFRRDELRTFELTLATPAQNDCVLTDINK
jgi:predicted metalloprotease with PDZ domain